MKHKRTAIQYREGQRVLFESSVRAVPFNIIVALILSASLVYNKLPSIIITSWLAAIIFVSVIRAIHCNLVVKLNLLDKKANLHLKLFLLTTGLMGLTWITIYFALLNQDNQLQLYLILLVCGGLAAGSTASLGVYLPAFFAYILAMFIPLIIYNYLIWTVNSAILATMVVLFILEISLIARSHQRLFADTFFLTEQNKELTAKFELLSITDPLTGLYNRRHFDKTFPEEYNRAKRNKHAFALVSIDIDNFKLINDNLGHPFGDQFLVYIGEYLKIYFKRSNDIIFRLGGDEFAILLINVTEESSQKICEKVQAHFLKSPSFKFSQHDKRHIAVLEQVSLSIGITFVPYEAKATTTQIIAMGDMTMYQSKTSGKNQITYLKCK